MTLQHPTTAEQNPSNGRAGPGTPAGPIDPTAMLAHPNERGVDRDLLLGPDARIRSGSVIYRASSIGARLNLGHHVVVREECEIGDDVSIWSNTVIDYGCRIGHRVKIHNNCYVAQFTVLGDDVFLAPGVSIANDLYPGDHRSASVMGGPTIRAGAQIGAGCTILPYVEIGEGALVGAGSVVTKDIPPGVVAYGHPAVPHKLVSELIPIDDRVPAATIDLSTGEPASDATEDRLPSDDMLATDRPDADRPTGRPARSR